MAKRAKLVRDGKMKVPERLFRTFAVKREAVDRDKRTVELSFSSETPVPRWFGNEILGHADGEANLDWLSSGRAPFLADHDTRQQIGVVDKAWIDPKDKMGRALVRLGSSPRAQQELDDMGSGIRSSISVGYQITRLTRIDDGEDGDDPLDLDDDDDDDEEPTYRAEWTPLEISTVALPADTAVGVGRESEGRERDVPVNFPSSTRNREMETAEQKAAREARERDERERSERSRTELAGASEAARKAERQRIADITALAERHNMGALGKEHVEKGTSIEEFRGIVLDKIPAGKPLYNDTAGDLGMSQKEAKEFSFLRAFRAQLPGVNARDAAPFEFEASTAIAKRLGRDPKGCFVPLDVQRSAVDAKLAEIAAVRLGLDTRALSVGTNNAGGYFVATDLLAQDFITLLRNRMMVRAMGARVMGGLVGNIAIPKQTTAASASWVAEASAPSESDQVVGQLTLSPKELMAYTDYSRLLMQQSSIDVENFVRTDLALIVALGVDLAALHGSGSSNQPTGIASTSGIGSEVGGTNGAAPTWANIINLETDVAAANADIGALGYLFNAKTRGKLKQTLKNPSGTTAEYIWPDIAGPAPGFGLVNGYKVGVSNQVSSTLTKGSSSGDCSALFYGNWDDLIIGEWGVLDLLVNPYTNATSGGIRIHAYQTVDVGVRRAASFSAMLDALCG